MFSYFKRRPLRATPVRAARLNLQSLDDRMVPAAPVISEFNATSISSGVYVVTGKVTDDDQTTTQGMIVTLGGGLQGADGKTVTVSSNGYFSITVTLTTLEAGTISAQTKDTDNNESNVPWQTVNPLPPSGKDNGGPVGGD